MKKIFGCLVSVMIAIVMSFAWAGCVNENHPLDGNAYAFVTIDINPSIELITLGDSVIDVKAANYDACVLLDGEDFSSCTVDQATEKIVSLAEDIGYLTDSNNQVKISVISDDAQTIEILKSATKSGAEKGSKKAVVTAETRLQDEVTVKKLKEDKPDKYKDLTEEKVRLIESLMEYDESLTYESGVDMTVNQLAEALKSAHDKNNDLFTEELRGEYSMRFAELKCEIEREIAEVYGEDYLNAWVKYNALKNVYNAIVKQIEDTGISEEDVLNVIQLLNITDVALIEKGGTVKPEYVLSYIDKHIGKKSEQVNQTAVNSVLEILEKYDASTYILTDTDIGNLSEAVGEDINFTLLSEIAENLSGRKAAIEEIKNSVNLTNEQIELIQTLKEGYTTIKDRVLAYMEDMISEARAEISAEKQARLSVY